MWTHVAKTVDSCFAALRQIRSIRRSVGASIFRLFFSVVTVGLRMRHSGWATSSVTGHAPVSVQCGRTADIREPSARPHDTIALQSSLVTGA